MSRLVQRDGEQPSRRTRVQTYPLQATDIKGLHLRFRGSRILLCICLRLLPLRLLVHALLPVGHACLRLLLLLLKVERAWHWSVRNTVSSSRVASARAVAQSHLHSQDQPRNWPARQGLLCHTGLAVGLQAARGRPVVHGHHARSKRVSHIPGAAEKERTTTARTC